MAYRTFKGIRKRTVLRIVSGDINRLSQDLRSRTYIHSLPTQLLFEAHNRIELQHLNNPKNKTLQKVHTHLFYEMELRQMDHFDTDPDFFTPTEIPPWPFTAPFDDLEIDTIFSKFIRFNSKLKGRFRKSLQG